MSVVTLNRWLGKTDPPLFDMLYFGHTELIVLHGWFVKTAVHLATPLFEYGQYVNCDHTNDELLVCILQTTTFSNGADKAW